MCNLNILYLKAILNLHQPPPIVILKRIETPSLLYYVSVCIYIYVCYNPTWWEENYLQQQQQQKNVLHSFLKLKGCVMALLCYTHTHTIYIHIYHAQVKFTLHSLCVFVCVYILPLRVDLLSWKNIFLKKKTNNNKKNQYITLWANTSHNMHTHIHYKFVKVFVWWSEGVTFSSSLNCYRVEKGVCVLY